MATVRIPEQNLTIRDEQEISAYLASIHIQYERWPSPGDPANQDVMAVYGAKIDELKRQGAYTTVDVMDVGPETPGLDGMMAKFSREHWHDEDEVRFIIAGRGVFHVHPTAGPVCAIEVEAGDLIRIPRGVHHWFDLCSDRIIRAIRLFQKTTGWTPNYTHSRAGENFLHVCFGPAFLPIVPSR